jgi:hypothetical protein
MLIISIFYEVKSRTFMRNIDKIQFIYNIKTYNNKKNNKY